MLPAMELTVWLETSMHQGMTTLIPYVSSAKDVELHYDVKLFTSSPAGRSNVAQGGDVRILAGEPHRLSSLTTKLLQSANLAYRTLHTRPKTVRLTGRLSVKRVPATTRASRSTNNPQVA